MTSAELYASGYALPWFCMNRDERIWRFYDEQISTPIDAVPLHNLDGLDFPVAKIEDVRAAHG